MNLRSRSSLASLLLCKRHVKSQEVFSFSCLTRSDRRDAFSASSFSSNRTQKVKKQVCEILCVNYQRLFLAHRLLFLLSFFLRDSYLIDHQVKTCMTIEEQN
mmetsp:Transcript_29279/g.53003  ORF Transcript_29279/g.53003 Transcript_29279/m.53003 type:complete len:102 (-) Transcript_29279:83-388(-)